jgi:hypothetical protein
MKIPATCVITKARDLTITSRYRIVENHPIGKVNRVPLFPALAIPVETKLGYECPEEHLECLRGQLPQVTKILIVGWRGTERHFLGLLQELLPREIPVCVVAGRKELAEEVFKRLREAGLRVKGTPAEGGFTEFIQRRGAEEFLRG